MCCVSVVVVAAATAAIDADACVRVRELIMNTKTTLCCRVA